MKRLLILLGLAAAALLIVPLFFPGFRSYWRCTFRNRHNPVRHPLGGFVCDTCKEASESLSGMVRGEEGYVATDRRQGPREERTH